VVAKKSKQKNDFCFFFLNKILSLDFSFLSFVASTLSLSLCPYRNLEEKKNKTGRG